MASPWDPDQYERFRGERRQPFMDLLDLVEPRPALHVVDLGCGTGELTRVLHERLGARKTLGIDSSPTMLARSEQFEGGGVSFGLSDITEFEPEAPVDLVFSNAALQWIGDHESLLRRMAGWLAGRGQIAVQVPANFDHESHTVADEVAAEEPFASALDPPVPPPRVQVPEWYATVLHRLGFSRMHVRLQVYPHLLVDQTQVVEWVKGTLLTRYREHLPQDVYEAFLDAYSRRLAARLPDERPFLFTFKRILFWAAR